MKTVLEFQTTSGVIFLLRTRTDICMVFHRKSGNTEEEERVRQGKDGSKKIQPGAILTSQLSVEKSLINAFLNQHHCSWKIPLADRECVSEQGNLTGSEPVCECVWVSDWWRKEETGGERRKRFLSISLFHRSLSLLSSFSYPTSPINYL